MILCFLLIIAVIFVVLHAYFIMDSINSSSPFGIVGCFMLSYSLSGFFCFLVFVEIFGFLGVFCFVFVSFVVCFFF